MQQYEVLVAQFAAGEEEVFVELPVAEVWEDKGFGNPLVSIHDYVGKPMIEICHRAHYYLEEKAAEKLGDVDDLKMLRIGKKGELREWDFLGAYTDDLDDGTFAGTVEAVDKEDAEFQALFLMTAKDLSVEEEGSHLFFMAMSSKDIVELDDRPGMNRVLDLLEKVVAEADEQGVSLNSLDGVRNVLRAYDREAEPGNHPSL